MTAAECGNMVISRKTKLESIDLCDTEASVRFTYIDTSPARFLCI